ncbi:MAG: hypothetical protein PHU12_01880 [Candidatus Aenigmarchaeota archaeon]|nr:hypothetical protein [Candidatus Aenigmarchaeota archaeon]
MSEEFEIVESSDKDNYSMIPVAPMKRLEARIEGLEKAGSVPQLQSLITQIIELIKTNQKIINEVIRANLDLRSELAKMPLKIDQLIDEMRDLIELIEAAGRQETSGVGPEAMKPIVEQVKNLADQNKAMMEAIDNLNRKIKSGTPVSKILSSYPSIKLKREM